MEDITIEGKVTAIYSRPDRIKGIRYGFQMNKENWIYGDRESCPVDKGQHIIVNCHHKGKWLIVDNIDMLDD